jgi:hypothetical protein
MLMSLNELQKDTQPMLGETMYDVEPYQSLLIDEKCSAVAIRLFVRSPVQALQSAKRVPNDNQPPHIKHPDYGSNRKTCCSAGLQAT